MKIVATFGPSRSQVRVIIEGDQVRVRWRVRGARKLRSYPNTPENRANAKAFARGVAEGREAPTERAPLTLRTLWEKYAEAEFPHLRANSQRLYREYYRRWETAWGLHFPVENTTQEMAHQFRRDLTKLKLATSTMRQTIRTVQMIYKWAERNEMLERNRLGLYRFQTAKNDRRETPAEFRGSEFAAIMAQLDPGSISQWRPFVALAICGHQGVRQTAVLHLRWADITGTHIKWRPEFDKMGHDWEQPLREGTREALVVARKWRETKKYRGEWVLFSGSKKNASETYSLQSLWTALRKAERRAGITHLTGRAGHGLRKMLAGDVAVMTGDALLAMNSIGDTDVRMAHTYLKKRPERIERVFRDLDDSRSRTEASEATNDETTTTLLPTGVKPL